MSNVPPNTYLGNTTRTRANTINRMDVIPPALARLTHLGASDPAGTRSALTPVLNRDEAIREWERRNTAHLGHAKRISIAPGNPQLDFLQEQAEMMHQGQGWSNQSGMQGYRMQPPPPVLESSGRPSQHRSGLSTDFGMLEPPSSSAGGSPRMYSGPAGLAGVGAGGAGPNNAFLPAFPPPAASAYDSYDPRGDSMGLGYTPLQANPLGGGGAHYHKTAHSTSYPSQQHHPGSSNMPYGNSAPNSPQYAQYASSPYSPRQPRRDDSGS